MSNDIRAAISDAAATENANNGWTNLDCGGAVLCEDGVPVRVSNGGSGEGDDYGCADSDEVKAETRALFPRLRLEFGAWQSAAGEPDATCSVRVLGS